MVEVVVNPELAIIDEIIQITVTGLPPHAPVTVDAYLPYYGTYHIGFGHYYSDAEGRIDVTQQPSLGGSYSGNVSMGLFTSMVPLPGKKSGGRLIVIGSAAEVLKFTLNVWKGHKSLDDLQKLHTSHFFFATIRDTNEPGYGVFSSHLRRNFICSTPSLRTYLHPSIKRIPLIDLKAAHGGMKIRGTMFVPPGKGPFPGVIDLFGNVGGCPEFRAALLAKQGYCSLALAYMNYQDLPAKTSYDFEMPYFDHAIDWFLQRTQVDSSLGGVGMVGVSFGAQLIYHLHMRNPKVKVGVLLSGSDFMFADPKFSGNPLTAGIMYLRDEAPMDGSHNSINGMMTTTPGKYLKFNRDPLHFPLDIPILFMYGDRESWVHNEGLREAIQQLRNSGKRNVYEYVAPGQGHLIEPPYMPLCLKSQQLRTNNDLSEINQVMSNWGGDAKDFEKGQIRAWNKLLHFLEKNLGGSRVASKI